MNINPEDPKWTAYVLGELTDAERAQVEQELESSAAAREAVEEIRIATALLQRELANEHATGLSAEQRRGIAATASPQRVRPVLRWAAAAAALAASVMIVASLSTWSLLRSKQAANDAPLPAMPAAQPEQARLEAHEQINSPLAAASREKVESAHKTIPIAALEQEAQQLPQEQTGQLVQQMAVPASPAGRTLEGAGVRPQALTLRVTSFAESKTLAAPGAALPASLPVLADRLDRPLFNTEAYDFISDNPFVRVAQDPLATFSIDIDTASYANMRRFLSMNQLPPKDSVRIEEMINYFTYDYPPPTGRHPVASYVEVAAAPWKPEHRLVRIGIKAREIDISKRPPSNLVFLIDVSGSMAPPEKLPLLKSAMKLLVEKLGEGDRVAIVTYAGASGLQLRSTSGDKKEAINDAIDNLGAGGSTNGAAGILLAYETAVASFIPGGINRVILATDGDFNVGVTNQGDLTRLIEEKAKSGVLLSVLGFGMGNYKDSTLEKLAGRGNGNYAYIDTLNEARKVLVEEMSGTLMTVAKDVKIQVEFNPAEVNAYRLIGYENRALRHEDFNDDKKDAGDMGAGHTVTALFEVVPRGVNIQIPGVDALKYQQQPVQSARRAPAGEILNLKVRYKDPEGNTSQLIETPVIDRGTAFNNASVDFQFAAAVASFGMILRDSPHKGQATMDTVMDIAEKNRGADKNGYRDEFVRLVRRAQGLPQIQ
jgi:Ca-activated chloride channel family protein